jgi:hypothetical protein
MAAYMVAPSSQPDLSWYPDTAATNHMTSDLRNLNLQYEEYTGQEQVKVGNGQVLNIAHIGASNLLQKHHLRLPNMLHVPQLTKNLFSVHKLAHDNNAILEFHSDLFCVKDQATGTILLQGKSKDGLYPLIPSATNHSSPAAYIGERTSTDQWHKRLGHPSTRIVQQVTSHFKLPVSSNKLSTSVCNACQLGKSHCLPFSSSPSVSNFPIELVFCDVWGPSPTLSVNLKIATMFHLWMTTVNSIGYFRLKQNLMFTQYLSNLLLMLKDFSLANSKQFKLTEEENFRY